MFKIIIFMNPRAMPIVMILVGFTNVSRRPELKESLWEAMLLCLFEQMHTPNGRRTND